MTPVRSRWNAPLEALNGRVHVRKLWCDSRLRVRPMSEYTSLSSSIYRLTQPRRIPLSATVYSTLTCGVKWIVVVGALLNQSCQHIVHARIRRQAQGRSLAFRSVGCNMGCHSPLSNCNRVCAHWSFFLSAIRQSFRFHCSEIILVTYSFG
jgi:hypothetical protein